MIKIRPPVAPTVTGTVSSLYVFSVTYPKCCFCGCKKRGVLETGVLPGIGNVWKCLECKGLYIEARRGTCERDSTELAEK